MPDLADILIYLDFSRIFDRKPTQKKYRDMQKQAEDMFLPEGITLDFGRGGYRCVAFERSASMGRNSRLSFIREDFYAPVKERIPPFRRMRQRTNTTAATLAASPLIRR